MADLKYSKSYEWIEEDGLCVILDYAQHSLGDRSGSSTSPEVPTR